MHTRIVLNEDNLVNNTTLDIFDHSSLNVYIDTR